MTKPYENGNTPSMATHLRQHHPYVLGQGLGTKIQRLITALFKQLFAAEQDRGTAIT